MYRMVCLVLSGGKDKLICVDVFVWMCIGLFLVKLVWKLVRCYF